MPNWKLTFLLHEYCSIGDIYCTFPILQQWMSGQLSSACFPFTLLPILKQEAVTVNWNAKSDCTWRIWGPVLLVHIALAPGKLFFISTACLHLFSSSSYLNLKLPPCPNSSLFLFFLLLLFPFSSEHCYHLEYGVFILLCCLSIILH